MLIKSAQDTYVNADFIVALYLDVVAAEGGTNALVMAQMGATQDTGTDPQLVFITNTDSATAQSEAQGAMDAIAAAIGSLDISALQAIPTP